MTADLYAWWRAAAYHGETGPIHEDSPLPGRYRVRQGREFVPVAIWWQGPLDENGELTDDAELICVMGFENDKKRVDPLMEWGRQGHVLWHDLARNPIKAELYNAAMKTGKWPDVDDAVVAEPVDDLASATESVKAGMLNIDQHYAKIDNDEHAARAQSLRSSLLELSREFDKKRTAEKGPHLEACKEIDGRWMPVVKSAKAAADKIASALNKYETEKARKHAEERINEPLPTQIKGGVGRAAAIKVVKIVTSIANGHAAFSWLLAAYPEEVNAFIIKLAQRATDTGHAVPGVNVEEHRRVA